MTAKSRRTSSWVRKVISGGGVAFWRGFISPTVYLFCRIPAIGAVENTHQIGCCETAVGYRTVGLLRKKCLTPRYSKVGARLAPSGHHRLRVGAEPRIPLAERRLPFTVQHAGADLQQQVSPPLAPSHLLLLHHTLAHHVVHRRLDKAGADALAGAIALAIVRDETAITFDIRGKFLHCLAQLPCGGVVALVGGGFEIAFHGSELL